MRASALESLELYQGAGSDPAAPVAKLDVAEVLRRTEGDFFAALAETRLARLRDALDEDDVDPLALDGDESAAADLAFSMKGRTVVVTGASRGIGEAIAVRCASRGANVVILAQTTKNNPALPGTIQDAAAACVAAGGDALAIKTDITDEDQVAAAISAAVDRFGGVDVVVNNASAHWPLTVAETDVRRYDAMMRVNLKGAHLVSRACAPHLRRSPAPRVLTVAPAPRADAGWLRPHCAYSASKIAMGFLTRALDDELGPDITCDTIWPRYAVATAAIQFIGGDRLAALSRTPASVADAAFRILVEPPGRRRGRHFVDDDVLRAAGVTSFSAYNVDPNVVEPVSDFFIREEAPVPEYARLPEPRERNPSKSSMEPSLESSRRNVLDDAVVLVVADAERDVRRRFLGAFLRRLFRRSSATRGVRLAVVAHARDRGEDERIEAVVREALDDDDEASDESRRVRPSYVQIADLSDAKTIPEVISNVVGRFYAVDAVVDLLRPPRPETRDVCLERLSSASYDDVFDAGVRASFLVAREALPHVAKSEGPRRFVSLCPPPRVSRRRSGSGPGVGAAVGLARAVRGLHVAGEAAEFAALDPPVGVFGVWSDAFDERSVETSETNEEDDAATKAIDALAEATLALLARDDDAGPNANPLAPGSFFSLDDDDDAGETSREAGFETIAYDDCAAGFADVAEEVADWVVVDSVWL